MDITAKNFDEKVLQEQGTVMVDFWAPWCGPCKMLGPIVEEVATECTDAKVYKLNVDDSMEIAQRYRVVTIPTLITFRDGQEVDRSVGLVTKDEILNMLKE